MEKQEWYVALADRWIGPLSVAQVHEKILKQELSWANYVWKDGLPSWERVCLVDAFQSLLPKTPNQILQKPVQDSRTWFLFYNETQYGPFYEDEIHRFIETGKAGRKAFVWSEGMETWQRIDRVENFRKAAERATAVSIKAKMPAYPKQVLSSAQNDVSLEHRDAPRQSLTARILLSDDKTVIVGLCHDISVGGMQVLTDKLPGAVGSRIKLNVSPSTSIEPFVAHGVIVRILEDRRGFSFRFEGLSEKTKRAVQRFVA